MKNVVIEYCLENVPWKPTAMFMALFITILYFGEKCLNRNPSKKSVPTFKNSRFAFFLSIMYEMQKRKRHHRPSFLFCQLLQCVCGFCVIFDKERIFRIYIFLRQFVFFFKPETVEVVLSSVVTIDKSDEYVFLCPWLGTGLLTSGGRKWQYRRKLLTPSFHFKILEDFIPIFNDKAGVLVSKIRGRETDEPIDIRPLITLCTLDIICETAMGVSMDVQKGGFDEYVQAIHEIAKIFFFRILRPWFYPDFIFYHSTVGKKFSKNIKIIHGFTRKGHDTTAMALCWVLYLVGQDDKVQKKIHEELDDIFGYDREREINREDLTRMKYLECVIKETLRLYPSIPFIAREVKESIKVLDYTIEPGSVCFIFPLMLHRDPKSFPNPERFDPERFFPENATGRHPYSYVPFSAGPRNCIGQKFAIMEEKIVLSSIFRNFRILSKDPRDKVNTIPNLVIRNLEPILMYFIPR